MLDILGVREFFQAHIFAAQLGGRALWLVPATFVLVMAAGGMALKTRETLPDGARVTVMLEPGDGE